MRSKSILIGSSVLFSLFLLSGCAENRGPNRLVGGKSKMAPRVRYVLGKQTSPTEERIRREVHSAFIREPWYGLDNETGNPLGNVYVNFHKRNHRLWFDLTLVGPDVTNPTRGKLQPISFRGEMKTETDADGEMVGIVQLPFHCTASAIKVGSIEPSEIGPVVPITFFQRCAENFQGLESIWEIYFQAESVIASRLNQPR